MLRRIILGHIAFRVRLAYPINPESPSARGIAASLARLLNQRLLQTGAAGKLPPCPIAAEVMNLRRGSLIADLQLHADISCERDSLTALGAFSKAYPDIRKTVLELASGIKIIAANVFGARAGMVEVQVEEPGLLSPAQLEAASGLGRKSQAEPTRVLQAVS